MADLLYDVFVSVAAFVLANVAAAFIIS
jgi:hypothetical protein